MTCEEQWTDEIGCYPSDRPHQCAVVIPHTAFHRCSCDAWIQVRPPADLRQAAVDRLLGRLTVKQYNDLLAIAAAAHLTPDALPEAYLSDGPVQIGART